MNYAKRTALLAVAAVILPWAVILLALCCFVQGCR